MTTRNVPTRIFEIFEQIKHTPYGGDVKLSRHFAVAIRKGKIITPVSCNYHRTYVFGKTRGTMHAEMNASNYVINTSGFTGFNKHKTRVLRPQLKKEHTGQKYTT